MSKVTRSHVKGGVGEEIGLTGKYAIVTRDDGRPPLIVQETVPRNPGLGIPQGVFKPGREIVYEGSDLARELKAAGGQDTQPVSFKSLARWSRSLSDEQRRDFRMGLD